MAGDWIKFEVATPDKAEVWAIADILEIDPDAVVGKLLRMWAWFDQHTEDGNAASVTKALLDRNVNVQGFCDAVISVGWMTESDGVIGVIGFEKHNGKSAKRRCITAKRASKHRDNSDSCDDVTQASRKSNAASVTRALPREDKDIKKKTLSSRESKKKNPPGGEGGFVLPPGVDPVAWEDFERHRRTTKSRLTDLARRKAANLLMNLPPGKQRECVDYSITGGYTGLFPERFSEDRHEKNRQSGGKLSAVDRAAAAARRLTDGIDDGPGEREVHGEVVGADGVDLRPPLDVGVR